MPKVEVYGKDEINPLFEGDFSFLPRIGDYISKDIGGYFEYYHVREVWHRERNTGVFDACVQVIDDDEMTASKKSLL